MTRHLALILAVTAAAQEPQFDVESRLVLVPVTVTDATGRTVDGLAPSEFAVLDNGREQKVDVDTFATGVAPVALVVAVQSSGISAAVLLKVQKIGTMIRPLVVGERGSAALVSFDDHVKWIQEFTNDEDALANAFKQLRPGEEKAACMLDAVEESIERLNKRTHVRRVLVLISESRDRGSKTSLDTAVLSAQRAGVVIYSFTYSAFKTAFTTKPSETPPAPVPPPTVHHGPMTPMGEIPMGGGIDIIGTVSEIARLANTKTSEALARSTGGRTYSFTRLRGLEDVTAKFGVELSSQYVLSFTPTDPKPGYHELQVRVTRHGKFLVRTRPGYWSTGAPSSL